jgi:hypothetical protein
MAPLLAIVPNVEKRVFVSLWGAGLMGELVEVAS